MRGRAARRGADASPGDAVQLLGVPPLRHAVGVLPALGGVDRRAARRARGVFAPPTRACVRALPDVRLRDLLGQPQQGSRPAYGRQHAPLRSGADGGRPDQGARRRQDLARARHVREAGAVDLARSRAGAPACADADADADACEPANVASTSSSSAALNARTDSPTPDRRRATEPGRLEAEPPRDALDLRRGPQQVRREPALDVRARTRIVRTAQLRAGQRPRPPAHAPRSTRSHHRSAHAPPPWRNRMSPPESSQAAP